MLMFTEVLPLVEFFLEDGMTDEEAVHILDMSVPKKKKERSWKENRMSRILWFCLVSVSLLLFFFVLFWVCLFFAFPSYISGVHHFWVRFLRM